MATAATARRLARCAIVAMAAGSILVVAWRGDAAELPVELPLELQHPTEAAPDRGPAAALAGLLEAPVDAGARGQELRRTAAGAPNGCSDWRDEPRSARNFVLLLVRQPDQVATEPLLRSTTFNPRDVPLSEADRGRIAATITEAAEAAAPLVASNQETLASEFAEARRRSQAVDVDQTRFEGRWALSQLGPEPLCREIDGTTWGVARKHMPASLRTRAAVARCGAEIVERLARDFTAAGALTAAECLDLAAAARAASAD